MATLTLQEVPALAEALAKAAPGEAVQIVHDGVVVAEVARSEAVLPVPELEARRRRDLIEELRRARERTTLGPEIDVVDLVREGRR